MLEVSMSSGSIRRTRTQGPLWSKMNAQPRVPASGLSKRDVVPDPGVYAWYHDGRAVYVGKAARLNDRIARHLGRDKAMAGSAFRRNVAESLGISTPGAIKSGGYRLNDDELARVRDFIEQCEVTWVVCNSPSEALRFEGHIKAEWLPPLTKL
jgi:hypothetical protein